MKRTINRLLCIILSVLMSVTALAVSASAEPTPVCIQYRSFDSAAGADQAGAFHHVSPETSNYLEGTGAVKWNVESSGTSLFWYIYCADMSGNGTDITGTSFITFDIYISDAAKWQFSSDGDKRITITNKDEPFWNSNAGESNNTDTAAIMSSWKTGWNHVVLPYTPGTDTQHAYALRMFTTNSTAEEGFYTIIDDINFVNQEYLDSQEYADKIAAKDVSALINSIGTVTKDSGAVIDTARTAYNTLNDTQKALVATYPVLTTAEETFASFTSEALCTQYRSFDDIEGTNKGGALTDILSEDQNYLEGTGACRWEANESGTSAFWFIYNPDMESNGLDISGTSYITFDIYINDITKWHFSDAGDKRITITNRDEPFWNSTAGETNTVDTAVMMSNWKTGWNHVVIPYTPGTDTENAYAIRMFTTNSTVDAGFYTIIDDVCFVNQKYLDSQEYADKIAAKDVSVLINGIGTVTKDSGAAIEAVRNAYDALTADQKPLTVNYNILRDAESAYANFAIAQAVIDKINLIGTVTKDSEALITDARGAYDALTSAQKKLVTNSDTLTAAEAAYADIQAAEDVIGKIDAIGTVTKESGTLIQTARGAYDLLTQAQKDLVTNYQTLIEAETAFAEFIVYGDINSDGEITAADALLALQSSVKKVVLTEDQQTAADVDGKDGVTAADALLILQYSVEKISSFPVEKKD